MPKTGETDPNQSTDERRIFKGLHKQATMEELDAKKEPHYVGLLAESKGCIDGIDALLNEVALFPVAVERSLSAPALPLVIGNTLPGLKQAS